MSGGVDSYVFVQADSAVLDLNMTQLRKLCQRQWRHVLTVVDASNSGTPPANAKGVGS